MRKQETINTFKKVFGNASENALGNSSRNATINSSRNFFGNALGNTFLKAVKNATGSASKNTLGKNWGMPRELFGACSSECLWKFFRTFHMDLEDLTRNWKKRLAKILGDAYNKCFEGCFKFTLTNMWEQFIGFPL